MNLFKRAFVSVTRNKGKNILLFLLTAGLGTIIFTAIVLNQSTYQIRDNLWRGLPPAIVIDTDYEALNEAREDGTLVWGEIPFLTANLIEPIAELPYVRTFDVFNGTTIYSRELERVLLDFPSDEQSLEGYPVVMMELNGITNPDVIDIETGMYELVSGRTFTAEEMNPTDPQHSVAMISHQLAELNGLEVGSFITLENNFYKYNLIDYEDYWGQTPDEHIIDSENYILEIIGIFDPVVIPDFGNVMQEVFANNVIFVPLTVVHSAMDFMEEGRNEDLRSQSINADWPTASEAPQRNIIFLHDAADLPAFIEAADVLLPPYHKVATFSNSVLAIERFDDSMNFFQKLSTQILWGGVGVKILALGLVILLFLRDRKHEIGIYLALGTKKTSIVKQILIEILIPTIAGIALALFLGNLIAGSIGREMLVNEIIAGQDFNLDDYGWSNAGAQFQWFMEGQMDTLIENYDVSLDGRTVTMFWGVAIVTVFISTVFPIFYLVRLNPKEILTFSQGS